MQLVEVAGGGGGGLHRIPALVDPEVLLQPEAAPGGGDELPRPGGARPGVGPAARSRSRSSRGRRCPGAAPPARAPGSSSGCSGWSGTSTCGTTCGPGPGRTGCTGRPVGCISTGMSYWAATAPTSKLERSVTRPSSTPSSSPPSISAPSSRRARSGLAVPSERTERSTSGAGRAAGSSTASSRARISSSSWVAGSSSPSSEGGVAAAPAFVAARGGAVGEGGAAALVRARRAERAISDIVLVCSGSGRGSRRPFDGRRRRGVGQTTRAPIHCVWSTRRCPGPRTRGR